MDTGFRLNIDGFAFTNYKKADYSLSLLRDLKGDDYVYKSTHPELIPYERAKGKVKTINDSLSCGHCAGFVISSLYFFSGVDTPSDFNPNASITHDLLQPDVAEMFAYYTGAGFFPPVREPVPWARDHLSVLEDLFIGMSGNAPDYLDLGFCNKDYYCCHGVTPYAIRWRVSPKTTAYLVYIYDSNGNSTDWGNDNLAIYPDDPDFAWIYFKSKEPVCIGRKSSPNLLQVLPLSLYKKYKAPPLEGNGPEETTIA